MVQSLGCAGPETAGAGAAAAGRSAALMASRLNSWEYEGTLKVRKEKAAIIKFLNIGPPTV